MLGVGTIKLFKKGLADAGAFLVDGVFGRVGEVADAVFYIALNDTVADLLVNVKQFCVIIA